MSYNIGVDIQEAKAQLIHQVYYFKEKRGNFLDQYSQDWSFKKRKTMDDYLGGYVQSIDMILENFSEESLQSCVLIGSKVEVFYVDENESDILTIVFPDKSNLEDNKVSFLSPIGYQLLMKKKNARLDLVLPNGETPVIIREVSFTNLGY